MAVLAIACAERRPVEPQPGEARRLTILAVNDVYRIEGVDERTRGGLARLRTLRAELERGDPELLVLHAGDMLFPSLLSRLYRGGQMIDVMNRLDGDESAFDERLFATFGNHELDVSGERGARNLDTQVEASHFRWLGTNLRFAVGEDGEPLVAAAQLVDTALIEAAGVTVGLFSLTTDMQRQDYVEAFLEPVATARQATRELRRRGAEVVIGLTHQRMSEDTALLAALGPAGPDLVIGGHEHSRQTAVVEGRRIIKADADARTAMVLSIAVGERGVGVGCLGGGAEPDCFYRVLDETIAGDQQVAASTEGWIERHGREYCAQLAEPPGCLDEVLSRTAVELVAEEEEIRKVETNLGSWVADLARSALADSGAQVAFINSGTLRLNQNIPAGAPLTRRLVEELFAYPSPLRLLRISGATLEQVAAHSVTDWTGNGRWLQVSGWAFVQDAAAETVSDLTLLTTDGARPVSPDETILAVTLDFLVNPQIGDQDGYTMLSPAQVVSTGRPAPELKEQVFEALRAAGSDGISPRVEGRICNPQLGGRQPCLAVASAGSG